MTDKYDFKDELTGHCYNTISSEILLGKHFNIIQNIRVVDAKYYMDHVGHILYNIKDKEELLSHDKYININDGKTVCEIPRDQVKQLVKYKNKYYIFGDKNLYIMNKKDKGLTYKLFNTHEYKIYSYCIIDDNLYIGLTERIMDFEYYNDLQLHKYICINMKTDKIEHIKHYKYNIDVDESIIAKYPLDKDVNIQVINSLSHMFSFDANTKKEYNIIINTAKTDEELRKLYPSGVITEHITKYYSSGEPYSFDDIFEIGCSRASAYRTVITCNDKSGKQIYEYIFKQDYYRTDKEKSYVFNGGIAYSGGMILDMTYIMLHIDFQTGEVTKIYTPNISFNLCLLHIEGDNKLIMFRNRYGDNHVTVYEFDLSMFRK